MLTSMHILRDEGHLYKLAEALSGSFMKFFVQLEVRSDREREPKNSPRFYYWVNRCKDHVNIARPLGPFNIGEYLALWNPVIGGGYLLFATYACSIGLAPCTVDSMGQLRFTLHLYNALKQQGLVSEKDVPMLECIDQRFEAGRAVWVGARPEKGAYASQFRIAARFQIVGGGSVGASRSITRRRPVTVFDFCASHEHVVQRKFKESSAGGSIRNATDEQRELLTSSIDLLTMVNMARDSMDKDKEWVLPINFTELGCILLEFNDVLSKVSGWESAIEDAIPRLHDNKAWSGWELRQKAMGVCIFDLLEDVDKREAVDITRAHAAAKCMISYFKGIPKSKYMFTVEVEDGEPEVAENWTFEVFTPEKVQSRTTSIQNGKSKQG